MTTDSHFVSRRIFLAGSLASTVAAGPIQAQEAPDPMCPRCGGVGRVPVGDAKPFVWLRGTPLPKWEVIVGEQFCPICQSGRKASELVAEAKAWVEAAVEKNKQWEERMGGKLACVVTRQAVVHTQLTTIQARAVGQAIETLTLHLKFVTDSLLLASTH